MVQPFQSAELIDTHADEFSHAVQIGNAITEKKVADVILGSAGSEFVQCGDGLRSWRIVQRAIVVKMGEETGAVVLLDRVPLKYAGLRYDEIWISEAQERMVLSVPQEKVDQQLLKLADDEDVEATVIGTFGTDKEELLLHYQDKLVGQLSMEFLHKGLPNSTRRAVIVSEPFSRRNLADAGSSD